MQIDALSISVLCVHLRKFSYEINLNFIFPCINGDKSVFFYIFLSTNFGSNVHFSLI